LLNIRNKSSKQ